MELYPWILWHSCPQETNVVSAYTSQIYFSICVCLKIWMLIIQGLEIIFLPYCPLATCLLTLTLVNTSIRLWTGWWGKLLKKNSNYFICLSTKIQLIKKTLTYSIFIKKTFKFLLHILCFNTCCLTSVTIGISYWLVWEHYYSSLQILNLSEWVYKMHGTVNVK